MSEKDVPMIELHKVDAAIVHAAKICRDVKIIFAIGMAAVIAIVYIFVSNYNARTKDWLSTIAQLQSRTTVSEVQDGKTVEQFAPP